MVEVSRMSSRSVVPLAAVAVAFGLAQLLFVRPGLGLGWDEAVYVSQVTPDVPDAHFSAPRARGLTWLVAPVARFTAEPVAIRLWMTLISSVGLVLAFLPWLRLVRRGVVALAALLFAGLWVVQFYGPAVYPNIMVAYGSVAAVGFFLLAARGPAWRTHSGSAWKTHVGLAGSVALVALVRPLDAACLGIALSLAALLVAKWRRAHLFLPLIAGTVIGAIPWVVESFLSYGGLLARIHGSSEVQGGLRPTVGFWYQLKAANGPALCRPCDKPFRFPYLAAWLPAIPIAVAAGVAVARREGRLAPYGLAAGCGLGLALPYLFFVGYAAPRFLIPAYALFALPVAKLLIWLGTRRPRRVFASVAVSVLVVHLALQHAVLDRRVTTTTEDRRDLPQIAAALRTAGVRPPCLLSGDAGGVPLVYEARCGYAGARGQGRLRKHAATHTVAHITRGARDPLGGWRSMRVETGRGEPWIIWLPPWTQPSSPADRPR